MHVNTITSVLEAGPTVLIMFMCHAISFVVDHEIISVIQLLPAYKSE